MASTVWPFIPFLVVRGFQLFFAIIVLGLSGYIGSSAENAWSPWFSLVTALFTLIGIGFLTVTFFIAPAFTAPLICLGVDAFLFLFWLISLAGFANQTSGYLALSSCRYYGDFCGSIKGNMAMIVFEFLLFLGSLIWSAWWFHRDRSGKTAGTNPEGGQVSAGAISGAPQTHGTYPMQQQQPVPNTFTPQPQYPVQYPQEQQYQHYPPQQQYAQAPVPPGPQGYQNQQ